MSKFSFFHQAVKGVAPGTPGMFLSEEGLKATNDQESIRQWRDSLRAPALPDVVVFERVGRVLGPALEYLASSCTPTAMAVRTWCLLYCLRPDLIQYESLVSASKRFGVSHQVINRVLRDFETAVPGFHFVRREPDNAGISRKLSSKNMQGRKTIQLRAALKKQGATHDLSEAERQFEQRAFASELLNSGNRVDVVDSKEERRAAFAGRGFDASV